MFTSVTCVVVRAVVPELELDDEVLMILLDEDVVLAVVVVVLLVTSPAITSASIPSKSSSV
jgi:hypothetical protein